MLGQMAAFPPPGIPSQPESDLIGRAKVQSTEHPRMLPPQTPSGVPRPTFGMCAAACGLLVALYCLSLACLFPGYLHPLTPFHVDFYRYVGDRTIPWMAILKSYPRPAAYAAEKVLATWGLPGFMLGEIAVSLASIVLTAALVLRLTPQLIALPFASFTLYCVLLVAHPDFYFEHRHDEPAEVSYFFLLLAFHLWMTYSHKRRWWLLPPILVSGILFAFSKETFYLALPCLIAALCIRQRSQWKRHASFGLMLLSLCAASLAWARHLSSPFVDPHAAATDPYHVDLSIRSLFHWFWFYVRHLYTPGSAALVLLALSLSRRRKPLFAVGLLFVLAGLGALAPHAALPRHIFEEYSWVGAPLALAPVLFVFSLQIDQRIMAGVSLLLCAICLWGPQGYKRRYGAYIDRWNIEQESINFNLLQSMERLRAIPAGSNVLIAGLETPFVPWAVPDFVHIALGNDKRWKVVLTPGDLKYQSERSTLIALPEVDPKAFDYVARYGPDGKLQSVQGKQWASQIGDPALVVPRLAEAQREISGPSPHAATFDRAIEAFLTWGAWDDAARAIAAAKAKGIVVRVPARQ